MTVEVFTDELHVMKCHAKSMKRYVMSIKLHAYNMI